MTAKRHILTIIDIETAPLTPDQQAPFYKAKPVAAPANYKDPEKIRAYKAEREVADLVAWQETSQLDGMRCRVCAFGYALGRDGKPEVRLHATEQELLLELVALIDSSDLVCAHNIGYDLGIVAQRCAINGLALPSIRGRNADYYDQRFIDTKALWKPRASSVQTPASLDAIGVALGMGSKPGSGKDFWQWDEPKKREYLTHDITVCQEIVRRMF